MDETVALVQRSLAAETRETFDRRVTEDAGFLRDEIASGALDNADFAVGMELECYTAAPGGRLASVPRDAVEETPVNGELGVHNVEVNTDPDLLPGGIERQADAIREQFDAARDRVDDRSFVLDAMWTIPPEEGTLAYFSAIDEIDGVVIAENMYPSPRYHALDNDILRAAGGVIDLDLPGVSFSVPSILVESLATSIQPHLQVPDVDAFADVYSAAVRTLGPVLALATNSPFLPADLYGDVDPDWLLSETHHELRVPVFEQSINAGQPRGKVRFPDDIDAPEDVVSEVVEDATLVPFLREWVQGDDRPEDAEYTDDFWEFSHKHGTYWRWLRGVIGGDPIDAENTERSLRIEYRPLPTQPSVTDIVGFQALVAGLLRELLATDHPLSDLAHDRAESSFYAAVEDGLDADLQWVTRSGEHTTETSRIYAELFDLARAGLDRLGTEASTVDRYLGAVEYRWAERTTPSRWKIERVREELDAGNDLQDAIEAMQRAYIERSGTPFPEWG